MPTFTIKLLKGGGVEVFDHDRTKTYTFSNSQQSMGTSIFEQSHHDKDGRPLLIRFQPDWVKNNELTFDISDEKLLQKAREQLEDGAAFNAGSRRRRPSRKYKKSAKRVFRKKSRSTRRR